MVYFPPMTKRQKEIQRAFFAKCGPNVATLATVFDTLPNIVFYIKDAAWRPEPTATATAVSAGVNYWRYRDLRTLTGEGQ